MEKVAKFEKVSFEQFVSDMKDNGSLLTEEELKNIYEHIPLPVRATKGSAGYDFYLPYEVSLKPQEGTKIVTGIRCAIQDGYFLALFPRSSLGFKYRMQLDNTVGIIDSDYYYADNQGHVMVKITNDSQKEKTLQLQAGSAFCQGILLKYYITDDDEVTQERKGGFGSTDHQ